MKQECTTEEQRIFCKVTIDYEDSVRSIDLENVLSGIRMICQHELAERTELKPRDFTSTIKIASIDKGSIIINFFTDLVQIHIDSNIAINLNLLQLDFDLTNVLFLIFTGKKAIPDKLKVYTRGIVSALPNLKSITFEGLKRNFKMITDKHGNISTIEEKQK